MSTDLSDDFDTSDTLISFHSYGSNKGSESQNSAHISGESTPLQAAEALGTPVCNTPESSEMRCLLDDSRTKITAPPRRQLNHLLHGRDATPETVL
jgi:hypothetical protein